MRSIMYGEESKAFAAEVAAYLTLVDGYAGRTKKAAFRCVRCGAEASVSPYKVLRDIAEGVDPCPACRRRAEVETYRLAVIKAVEASGIEIIGDPPASGGRLIGLKCSRGHLFALTGKRLLQGDGCPECAYEDRRKRNCTRHVGIGSLVQRPLGHSMKGETQ